MKRVEADFRPRRIPSRLLWLLAAASVAAGVVATGFAWKQQLALQGAQAALQALRQAQQEASLAATALPVTKVYDKSAREMLHERALRWAEALRALEATTMEGVVLKSFEANAADRVIRVEIVTKDHATVAEYLNALSAGSQPDGPDLQWKVLRTSSDIGGTTVTATLGVK
jgi:hypothetical protein